MKIKMKELRICQRCKKRFEYEIKRGKGKSFCSEDCFKAHRKEYLRNKQREYLRTPEGLQKHRNWSKAFNLKLREKQLILRLEVKKKIGDRCILCNRTQELNFHEKEGKNHLEKRFENNIKFYLANPDNFVPLCAHHHILIHELANLRKESNSNYEKLLELVLLIN